MPLPIRRGVGWVKRQLSPHWLWETKEFKEYFAFLQKSQWWSLEELRSYQEERLKELVKFAFEKVPYYQRTFKEKHLCPSDIKTLDDIQLLPLITKQEVRAHLEEFIPVDIDQSKLRIWTTGGSSGIPLKIYLDNFYSSMIEEAFSLRQRLWAGYQFYDPKATLTRASLDKWPTRRCWDYNNIENEIVLKSHDMTERNLFEFVNVIQKFRPKFIVGYPSSLEIFARFIKRNNPCLPPLKAIFSGSEALFPGQRYLIESAFNCKVYSGYGMSERIADAIECEQHTGYHINMEYGIFELVDKNNEAIDKAGVSGCVVGTGFHNNVMPLIRYQMFDIAVYAGEKCACGRAAPLVKDFKGRFSEYFVGRTGKLIPLQLVWSGRHVVWSKIREMKFEQKCKGTVVAKIVPADNCSNEEIICELRNEVQKVLTEDEFDLQFNFVDSLSLTHRGKLNFLDQKIPLSFEDLVNVGYE